jgi:hypothetical protein
MGTIILHQALLGFARLVATAAVAGWVGSPMSWSPDSRWLGYTVVSDPGSPERHPGGLFDATPGDPTSPSIRGVAEGRQDDAPIAPVGPSISRIWASQRDGGASVLIAESAAPLSSPRWSPRGRSLAFVRFIADPMSTAGPSPRGRLEVVIQDRLDRERPLLALPNFELDDEARARFPHVGPAWSPDGQYLAIPRPGRSPSIVIVRVDARRVLRSIDGALLPAWSPDGTRLAFIHRDEQGDHSLQVVERQGQAMSVPRDLQPIGRIVAAPGWGGDGRSILAVVERARLHFPDLNLVRISAESGEPTPVFSLVAEPQRRMTTVRGIAIDFDRNEDLCFFSADVEGRDTDVCWSIPREQVPYKRFHPLDFSMRIGGLAIAPDGRAVAMRFGTPEALSPPAVCELETDRNPPTERTILIVPDEAARRAWRGLLARTARSLLAIAMPPVALDGKPIARPAWLPMPDEIPATPAIRSRFARLGRYGASVCATRPGTEANATRPRTDPDAEAEAELDLEDRLLFDYLRGDYAAATADLEDLEARGGDRRRRLALLGLRAQILWAQGETDRARDVAAYLLEAAGGPVYRVDETPIGRSLVPEPESARDWARYLAMRAAQPQAPTSPDHPEPNPLERDDAALLNPFAPFGPPGIGLPREPGPADVVPFGLNPQDAQREMIRALRLQLEQRLQEDARRRQAQPPPPPRPIDRRPLR